MCREEEKLFLWKKGSNSAYRLFFLSYITILLITISSLFVYHAAISRQVATEMQHTKFALLNRLCENLENKLEYPDLLYNDFIADNKLTLLAKGYSSYTYSELLKDLERTYLPDYISNFSIYIADKEEIITCGVHMRAPLFFTYLYQIRGNSDELFDQIYSDSYHHVTVMLPVVVSAYGYAPEKVLPYIRSFPPNNNKSTIGQFLFFIKTDDTEDLIRELHQSTRSNIYIFDESNQMMFCSEGATQPTKAFLSELVDGGEMLEASMGHNRYMVTQKVSPVSRWRYVLATSKSVYLLENRKFVMYFVVIFLTYLVIGLVAVRFLTGRSYKPVKEIKNIIDGIYTEDEAVHSGVGYEYREIKRMIVNQIKQSCMLSEIIRVQMPIVRRDYLLSLVKGLEADYEQAPQKLKALEITLLSDCFLILALEFDLDSPFFMEGDSLTEEKLSAARVIVQDIGSKLIPSSYIHYFLNLDMNRSIFLVNSEDEKLIDDGFRAFLDCVRQISTYLFEKFNINTYMGIGAIRNLPKCLDEAQKALDISRQRQICEVICYTDESDLCMNFYFPAEMEYQLVSHLKNSKFRESRELLDHIFEMNGLTSDHTKEEAPPAFLYELSAVFVCVINREHTKQGKPLLTCDGMMAELRLSELISLKEAKHYFMQLIDRMAALSGSKGIGKTEVLVNNIAEFIDENAGENWLDLTVLSEKFEVTPQYISNIFKKYKKESIKDYISKTKIRRAKELLSGTDLSIHDISIRIGYMNELGIFRLFKKYENMTPGEYRNLSNAAKLKF
mgnify:CR=1 FL=1